MKPENMHRASHLQLFFQTETGAKRPCNGVFGLGKRPTKLLKKGEVSVCYQRLTQKVDLATDIQQNKD